MTFKRFQEIKDSTHPVGSIYGVGNESIIWELIEFIESSILHTDYLKYHNNAFWKEKYKQSDDNLC